MDDSPESVAVDEPRDQIDLYSYLSLAVSGLQSQAARIEVQERELRALRLRVDRRELRPGDLGSNRNDSARPVRRLARTIQGPSVRPR